MLKRVLAILASVTVVITIILSGTYFVISSGWFGDHEGPGTLSGKRQPTTIIADRSAAQDMSAAKIGAQGQKQILFGDFHVHTTFSTDAFMTSLPIMGGQGAHPPADACDFARFCSSLDFWSINDHAENMPNRHWREIVDTIRQCNADAGDAASPDTVAYLGWEWTQVGTSVETHYGHKNVVLADLDADKIPTRPIASRSRTAQALNLPGWVSVAAVITQPEDRYWTMAKFFAERAALTRCPANTPVRDMPADCYEDVVTPAELFARLDDWGHRSIVIPHGTTWGFYTPPGATWDKQLKGDMHDEDRQTMFEIYSGHGNSEEYRDWRAVTINDPSNPATNTCPQPVEGYLHSCWRAGEIIRARCEDAGMDTAKCDSLAAKARNDYARVGSAGSAVIPGESADEWLDAGQCVDCFQPSFNYRPGGSAQYVLALTNFDDPANPRRFKFAMMSSSDNHTGRPGTGYKEVARKAMTDGAGTPSPAFAAFLAGSQEPLPQSYTYNNSAELLASGTNPFQLLETERQGAYFQTGGLIAVHSPSRDRETIWQSLEQKEVYGTSGPRILLWFNLLNGPEGTTLPMGSETQMNEAPTFEVKAVGSFKQKPGCPDFAKEALGAERLAYVCRNECYNPSDERRLISKIDIVRIRPQTAPDENIADLIDDPWKSFDCAPDANGCAVSFTDPEFAEMGRDAVYYARAIEEPSLTIRADKLRCDYDADGKCIKASPCYSDYRTDDEDDCLAPNAHRAWSSPIFVNQAPKALVQSQMR